MSNSTNEEYKNIYLKCRKDLGYTRSEACDYFNTISVDRLERIENGRMVPTPRDISEMAKGYKAPFLCNYYCTHDCELGKDFVEEIKIKDLSQIVLETLALLNNISEKRNRLIEITVDGKITGEELKDFIAIKKELEHISMTVDSLKLWTEQMKSKGAINEEEYEKALEEYNKNR